MKFGITQFFEHTPKTLAKVGNVLLLIASTATAYVHFQPDSVVAQALQVVSLVGTLFVNLFGDKTNSVSQIKIK